jgi:hypothetical protein
MDANTAIYEIVKEYADYAQEFMEQYMLDENESTKSAMNQDASKDIFDPKNSRLDNPNMAILLDSLVTEIQQGNTPPLYKFLGDLESRNNPNAVNKIGSTAKGIYQFTDGAVESAKNSAKRNVGFDHDYINAIPNNPTKWTQEQADIMLSSYLFPHVIKGKRGLADELIQKSVGSQYFKPEWEAIYDLILHTSMGKTKYKKDIIENKKTIFPKYQKP